MPSPWSVSGVLNLLLSPTGAIGRGQFALGAALLASSAMLFDGLLSRISDGAGITGFLFVISIAWSAGCLSRKRLHDIGWSGLAIVLFLAAYILVVLSAPFLPDMPGRASVSMVLVAGPAAAWIIWLLVAPGVGKVRMASSQPVVLA